MAKDRDKYDDDDDYDDDYGEESPSSKSLKGYKLMILLLVVVLVAVSGLYFFQSHRLRVDFAIERDTLIGRMMVVQNNFANLETTNLALTDSIVLERNRTDSVMDALIKERSVTRATIRRYEAALGTLRAAAEGFAYTIDSLSRLNERLISQNVTMRREISSERLRADKAEERAADADIKIRQGARVIARDIRLVMLGKNDNEVTRALRASRLRVDLVLSANNLANPGNRGIYARITGPDGYVMANSSAATIDFEGDPIVYSAMREVDYQNNDLPVGIYYSGRDISAGTYRIDIYMDGLLAGSAEALVR